MATSKLPIKIKVDIRDHFEAPACAVQKEFKTLEDVVGLKVKCNLEWDMLWAELNTSFPDKATFVPNVTGVIAAWCNVLANRLEDDKFTSWTDDLVGKVEAAGAVKLQVQVSDDPRPKTTWLQGPSSFVLALPRNTAFRPAKSSAGLETDFQDLFTSESGTTLAGDSSGKEDDWAAIDETGEARSIRLKEPGEHVVEADVLPSVETLSRPDILFRTLTPYLLNVTLQGSNKIVIHGTHEPSLQILSDYLQRWTKRDHRDVRKVPLLRVTLGESSFGLGLSYDALSIEPFDHLQRHVEVNPTILLGFVEGVLGYRLTHTESCSWQFRRDAGFK